MNSIFKPRRRSTPIDHLHQLMAHWEFTIYALFERHKAGREKVSSNGLDRVMYSSSIALGDFALLPYCTSLQTVSLMISAGYNCIHLWPGAMKCCLPVSLLDLAFIMGFIVIMPEGSLVQAGLRQHGRMKRRGSLTLSWPTPSVCICWRFHRAAL